MTSGTRSAPALKKDSNMNRDMANRNVGAFICNPIVTVSLPPRTTEPWYFCKDCNTESSANSPHDDCCPNCGGIDCVYLGQRGIILRNFNK